MDAEEARLKELEPVLARIPERWGKWVSCGPGWSKIILEANERLARLDPDYEIQQVKEKFGGLRYYASPSEGKAELHREFSRIIVDAEAQASRTCEDCGSDDSTVTTSAIAYWVRTLCGECRDRAEAARLRVRTA